MLSKHYCFVHLMLLTLSFTWPGTSIACLYHESGGGYALWHGKSLNSRESNSSTSSLTPKPPALKLSSPSMLRAKVNSLHELKVGYEYLSSTVDHAFQLSIDFGLGRGIDLATRDKVNLVNLSGEHTFTLDTTKVGTYRLRLAARNAEDPNQSPIFRTVFVSVTEE